MALAFKAFKTCFQLSYQLVLLHLCCHCFHLWECLSVYFHVNPYNTPHELVFKDRGGEACYQKEFPGRNWCGGEGGGLIYG